MRFYVSTLHNQGAEVVVALVLTFGGNSPVPKVLVPK
jgi:hypothetical protein